MVAKLSGEAYRSIRLCVDSYRAGDAKGHYYHPELENGGRAFGSLVQFLVEAENLFDSINFPQSYTAKRSFAPVRGPGPELPPGSGQQRGKCATFEIRLLFRQHTSWQGSLIWVEQNSEEFFRSVLELLFLVTSALGGIGEEPA